MEPITKVEYTPLVAPLGYKYVIGFGYYHPICVENNSSKSVVVKYRCLDKYFFTGGNVVIKYTDWQTTTLSSNVTKELTGFEPMEIKFEAGALGDGTHAYSVTDQRGLPKG